MLDELNFVQLIGNVGFPIAITIYLLYRFEKRLEKLEDAILNLATVVRREEE